MNGALISGKTSKQTCVALSTAEAEYVALASAAQEAVWLNQFLADIHCSHKLPIVINEDNQAAISIAKNRKEHSKTKHIAIKYHFARDKIADNETALQCCPTESMLADIFTKALTGEKFIKLREMIGVVTYSKRIHGVEEC